MGLACSPKHIGLKGSQRCLPGHKRHNRRYSWHKEQKASQLCGGSSNNEKQSLSSKRSNYVVRNISPIVHFNGCCSEVQGQSQKSHTTDEQDRSSDKLAKVDDYNLTCRCMGEPSATTHSPTLRVEDFPSRTAGRARSESILTTARSDTLHTQRHFQELSTFSGRALTQAHPTSKTKKWVGGGAGCQILSSFKRIGARVSQP